jgi:hypothetical protein
MEARGVRNNNPLNIRKTSQTFVGEVESSDNSFERFSSIEYGFRAAFRVLHTYYIRYKCNTISKLITRWAPSNENNTVNYINIVSKLSKLDKNKVFTWNEDALVPIVRSMAKVETGVMYPEDVIRKGYELSGFKES